MFRKAFFMVGVCGLVMSGCSQSAQESTPAAGSSTQQSQPAVQTTAAAPAANIAVAPSAAQTVAEVIAYAKKIDVVAGKKEYLMAQIQQYYNAAEFQSVIDVAQYVLTAVDPESSEAKEWIAKAESAVKEKVAQVGQVINSTFTTPK